MTDLVLDASVILKWFARAEEARSGEARRLRARYEAGALLVTVPALLHLEILNVAGRRWGWEREPLLELAISLEELDFDVVDPPLDLVAEWTARGLTSYDAAYVALAQNLALGLVTDDDRILAVAPDVARSLSSVD